MMCLAVAMFYLKKTTKNYYIKKYINFKNLEIYVNVLKIYIIVITRGQYTDNTLTKG